MANAIDLSLKNVLSARRKLDRARANVERLEFQLELFIDNHKNSFPLSTYQIDRICKFVADGGAFCCDHKKNLFEFGLDTIWVTCLEKWWNDHGGCAYTKYPDLLVELVNDLHRFLSQKTKW